MDLLSQRVIYGPARDMLRFAFWKDDWACTEEWNDTEASETTSCSGEKWCRFIAQVMRRGRKRGMLRWKQWNEWLIIYKAEVKAAPLSHTHMLPTSGFFLKGCWHWPRQKKRSPWEMQAKEGGDRIDLYFLFVMMEQWRHKRTLFVWLLTYSKFFCYFLFHCTFMKSYLLAFRNYPYVEIKYICTQIKDILKCKGTWKELKTSQSLLAATSQQRMRQVT